MAYAITVEAERLTPILQWTKHLDWFFLQCTEHTSVKSHIERAKYVACFNEKNLK